MRINIDLRSLRVVLAVIEFGSYTKAAEHLHVAQSSVTRTIQNVEAELGVQLFHRTTRTVHPTHDGEFFASIARSILLSYDTGLQHFQGYLKGKKGAITLATVSSVASTLLPEILSLFYATHPEIDISIEDGFSVETLERVRNGQVDFSITPLQADSKEFNATTLATDDFVCIFHPNHRFRQQLSIKWDDLHGETLIAFDHRSNIYQQMQGLLNALGIQPEMRLRAREINVIGGLVSAGTGVSVIPSLLLPTLEFASFEYRRLVNPVLSRRICVLTNNDRIITKPALELLTLFQKINSYGIKLPPHVRWAL